MDLDLINSDNRFYAIFKLTSVDPFIAGVCIFHRLNCWYFNPKDIMTLLKSDVEKLLESRCCGTIKHFNKSTMRHTTYFGGSLIRAPRDSIDSGACREITCFSADSLLDLIWQLKTAILGYYL